ncbi:MAG: SRPBCC family protein, partial [Dehalococcoidia bacterium]
MADWQHSTEATIQASAQSLFDTVADFAGHPTLAGSDEVMSISLVTSGPVGFGTVYEAQEKVRMGEDSMELGATGVVVTYDPPNTISWINAPPSVPLRRIQWWFHFKAEGSGTKVVHEVEVDFGELTDPGQLPRQLRGGSGPLRTRWDEKDPRKPGPVSPLINRA